MRSDFVHKRATYHPLASTLGTIKFVRNFYSRARLLVCMASGFECEKCGIAHKHDEGLDHSLSGTLSSATVALSLDLDYNPDCHCGWHELNADIKKGEMDIDEEVAEFIDYRCKYLLIPDTLEEKLYKQAQTSD